MTKDFRTKDKIQFWLGEELIDAAHFAPETTVLQYLRDQQKLNGSKEGCAEGDCGACSILMLSLGQQDQLQIEPVNACIHLLAMLDQKQIVTVDHIADLPVAIKSVGHKLGENLHPVQQAMVTHHGSQCGFCTPGFVISLFYHWVNQLERSRRDVEISLAGNLCRCTGYAPILKAAQNLPELDKATIQWLADVKDRLVALKSDDAVHIQYHNQNLHIPKKADQLSELKKNHPVGQLIAGGTDVGLWITKGLRSFERIIFLKDCRDLHNITMDDTHLHIGAAVTWHHLLNYIKKSKQLYFDPSFIRTLERFGSTPVRAAGTVCGNIANGSPIGDGPPLLIVLEAIVSMRCGEEVRTINLEDFFIEYGQQDLKEGEWVFQVSIPLTALKSSPDMICYAHKISKRVEQDISALLGVFRIKLDTDGYVEDARICYGGMAGIPKRAHQVEAALKGLLWAIDDITPILGSYDQDFTPMSDHRASQDYRNQVARNLLLKAVIHDPLTYDGASI